MRTVMLLWLLALTPATPVDVEDFTDTGMGCVDDCLEPVQDEADTKISMERN